MALNKHITKKGADPFYLACAILLLNTGCASSMAIKNLSDVYEEPETNILSINGVSDDWLNICIEGEYSSKGYGNYEIFLDGTAIAASHKTREDLPISINGEFQYFNKEIPSFYIDEDTIKYGCKLESDESTQKAVFIDPGKKDFIVLDANESPVALIHINTIYDLKPIGYVALPFAFIFDVITSPIQLIVAIASQGP